MQEPTLLMGALESLMVFMFIMVAIGIALAIGD